MFEKERKALVATLHRRGINDVRVLKAFLEVPRHEFVPQIMVPRAYEDTPLPIGYKQFISQPYTVAVMTSALNLNTGARVLEIGTGSGYQAAILYELGYKVYTIERNYELYTATRKIFEKKNLRILAKYGDGTIGWEEYSPFDGIIVTAGSPKIPGSLTKQLAIGGRLIIPVGTMDTQKMYIVERVSEEEYKNTILPDFKFVPLIGKEGWNDG